MPDRRGAGRSESGTGVGGGGLPVAHVDGDGELAELGVEPVDGVVDSPVAAGQDSQTSSGGRLP